MTRTRTASSSGAPSRPNTSPKLRKALIPELKVSFLIHPYLYLKDIDWRCWGRNKVEIRLVKLQLLQNHSNLKQGSINEYVTLYTWKHAVGVHCIELAWLTCRMTSICNKIHPEKANTRARHSPKTSFSETAPHTKFLPAFSLSKSFFFELWEAKAKGTSGQIRRGPGYSDYRS